jgi:hypothetical protein
MERMAECVNAFSTKRMVQCVNVECMCEWGKMGKQTIFPTYIFMCPD